MLRWMNVIVLFGCTATPMLAQTPKQPNSAAQAPASEPPKTSTGQTAAAASTTTYPLNDIQNFSAVMIGSRAERGEGTSRGHIYRLGSLLRIEEPGGHAYFITDLDSGETYGIVENNCIHDDHPYVRAIPFYLAGMAQATVTHASAGKETVDGHSCQVEDITVSSPTFPNPQKMRFWEAEDLESFPIKIEFVLQAGHGPIIRYKNVVLGPQDPTLFIRPKSCQALPQKPSSSAEPKPPG